jgi:hypothetical protein
MRRKNELLQIIVLKWITKINRLSLRQNLPLFVFEIGEDDEDIKIFFLSWMKQQKHRFNNESIIGCILFREFNLIDLSSYKITNLFSEEKLPREKGPTKEFY